MKTIKLICKGIILYFTMFLSLFFICTADNMSIITILITICTIIFLIYECNKHIKEEEYDKLLLFEYFDKLF